MSRGPGRVQRAITEAFRTEGKAYTVEDLFLTAYPEALKLERKHRVAITRAATEVCKTTGWTYRNDDRRGGGLIYYNPFDVMSYAMARRKGDMFSYYQRRGYTWRKDTEADLEANFLPGGCDHELVAEGGAWWADVQCNIAKRDGDTKTYERLTAKRKAESGEWSQAFKAIGQTKAR